MYLPCWSQPPGQGCTSVTNGPSHHHITDLVPSISGSDGTKARQFLWVSAFPSVSKMMVTPPATLTRKSKVAACGSAVADLVTRGEALPLEGDLVAWS